METAIYMHEIDKLVQVLGTPEFEAERIHKTGRKIIGYLCSYVPEELIMAAGFHPMRIFSTQPDILHADGHLQSYCCAPVRGILEDSLSGRLDFIDGMVFPQTCDTIQRLSDIWRLNRTDSFFADLSWPVKMNSQSSIAYTEDILIRFKTQLETYSGKRISENDVSKAIGITNHIRTLISRLYRLCDERPGLLPVKDLYSLVKGSMVLAKKEMIILLEAVLEKLDAKPVHAFTGKRILLSGATCEFPDMTEIIESNGACVVGDDFCTGLRWHDFQTRTDMEPVAALAHRYQNRMICPAKHQGLTTRADQLTTLAADNKADGVIFMLAKFCDPHAFDYPYIKASLEKKDIKTLIIETDGPHQGDGQITTRIETFIHTL